MTAAGSRKSVGLEFWTKVWIGRVVTSFSPKYIKRLTRASKNTPARDTHIRQWCGQFRLLGRGQSPFTLRRGLFVGLEENRIHKASAAADRDRDRRSVPRGGE